MMILMAKGFIIATPFIVRSISGNIMMPALSAGMGGAYGFGKALGGNQQAYSLGHTLGYLRNTVANLMERGPVSGHLNR